MLKICSSASLFRLVIAASASFGLGVAEAQMTRLPPGPPAALRGANPYASQTPSRISGMRVVADRAVNTLASSPSMRQLQAAKQAEKNGDNEAAAKLYGQALASFPNDRNALIHYARFKHRAGQLDSAIVTYQQCLKFYPKDGTAHNDIGLCFSRKGELAKAIQHVENAVRCDPSSKRYRNNLATLCVEVQQTERALAILCEVHGKAVGNYNVACLLTKRNRNAEAAKYLQQALVLDPSLTPASELLTAIRPGNDAIANGLKVASNDLGTIERQSAESSNTETSPSSAVYYQEESGRAAPPEVDAFPIPGMNR